MTLGEAMVLISTIHAKEHEACERLPPHPAKPDIAWVQSCRLHTSKPKWKYKNDLTQWRVSVMSKYKPGRQELRWSERQATGGTSPGCSGGLSGCSWTPGSCRCTLWDTANHTITNESEKQHEVSRHGSQCLHYLNVELFPGRANFYS